MNDEQGKSLLARLFERFFPRTPDFFGLLAEQSRQVEHTVALLVRYMETGDAAVGEQIKEDEHAADTRQGAQHPHRSTRRSRRRSTARTSTARSPRSTRWSTPARTRSAKCMRSISSPTPSRSRWRNCCYERRGRAGRGLREARQPARSLVRRRRRRAQGRAQGGKTLSQVAGRSYSRATTTSTCSSAARSIATSPTPPSAWPPAPTRCTTSW